jgi:RNA polymerase sigma-70 factor (ECF subfamily)
MSEESFHDVMARLRTGNDAAAAEVFQRFAHRLIGLARTHLESRLRQKVDPEDVLQLVYKSFFVRFAKGQFAPEDWDSLWSLLTVITVRKCGRERDRYFASKRDVRAEVSATHADAAPDTCWEAVGRVPTPYEGIMLSELVDQVLRGQDERDRAITTLALQGNDVADIAREIGCSTRTVYRVLDGVKEHLQRLHNGEHEGA